MSTYRLWMLEDALNRKRSKWREKGRQITRREFMINISMRGMEKDLQIGFAQVTHDVTDTESWICRRNWFLEKEYIHFPPQTNWHHLNVHI